MRKLVLASALAVSGCATASYSDDAVTRFVERAEMCEHWAGEEPYDDARRAEIDRALNDLRCTTITRDGEALKLSRKDRPEDLRRIDGALAGF
ncbi:MAG: hypothetical protein QME55_01595 [Brevundimonas sp.]|uniref:hypothetical protein n=1 Tax=Brevundimonas sp. TaxID=1871086 RepID=UPI00262E66DC|nr:hypothetical protein [Brevundimonas sp.]MDI6623397.1 hypothetical protein [Brevundimonas sp.]MDQ7811785.1 hypothetical protein [Brevundimonas sp.]